MKAGGPKDLMEGDLCTAIDGTPICRLKDVENLANGVDEIELVCTLEFPDFDPKV